MKVISKQYTSKNEASNRIVDDVSKVLLPHLEYLIKFLKKVGSVSYDYNYNRSISFQGTSININNINKNNCRFLNSVKIFINHDNFTIKLSSSNRDTIFFEFKNFKEHIVEKYGDSERIAFCQGLAKYVEFLQEEVWEIEDLENTIEIIKKTKHKREVITEKNVD
jgi:hypothetical protein